MAASGDNINVSINVTSDQAEAGADKASGSIAGAVQEIQKQMERLIASTQQSTSAVQHGFGQMAASAVQTSAQMQASTQASAAAMQSAATQIVAANTELQRSYAQTVASGRRAASTTANVGHVSTGVSRELIVLAHELAMGNYKRFGGSMMVLAEQMDWLHKVMNPVGASAAVLAGAIAIAGLAALHGSEQMAELRDSLVLTGNFAGITAGQFMEMGNEIADSTGRPITAVRTALAAVAGTGRFTGQALLPVAEAVAKIGQFSSASAEQVAKSFEGMSEGVYKWAVKYNESYHFATNAQLEHIRTLELEGEKERAEVETANMVVAKINETATQLGYLPGIWAAVRNSAAQAWDAMENWGRPLTIDDQIAKLKGQLNSDSFGEGTQMTTEADRRRLRALEQQRDQQRAAAAEQAKSAEVQQQGTKATIELRSEWKGLGGDVQLATDEVNRFRTAIESAKRAAKDSGTAVSPDIQRMIDTQPQIEAAIRKKYDRKDFKTPRGQVTVGNQYSQANAEAQSQLNITKERLREETDELDRSYRARQVSLQAYFARRLQITLSGMDAETAVVRQQLQQTQALEGQAKTPQDRLSMKVKEIELTGRLNVMEAQRSDAVRKSSQEMQDAIAVESKGLQDLAARRANSGFSEAQQRAMLVANEEVRQGRMTQAQLIELERQFEQQKTSLAIQAVQQRLDTEKTLTRVQQQELQDEQLQLYQQGQTKQLQLAIEANAAQMQSARQVTNSIEDGFSRTFSTIVDGTANGKQAFSNFLMSVDQQITQLASKGFFNTLTHMQFGDGKSLDSLFMSGASKLAPGAGGDAATTAHTTAVTADTSGLTAMVAALEASTVALTAFAASLNAQSVSNLGGLSGAGGGLGGIFGEGTGGSNAFGFTMPDGSLGDIMPSIGGNAFGFTMPSFDVGTPYVPHDMIAQIHQGEMIVPAHLNSPYNPGNSTITNQFYMTGQVDTRTQAQIASMAGSSIQRALQRNG